MVESGPGTPVLVSSAARALHVPRDCISVRRLNLTTLITGPDRPAVHSKLEGLLSPSHRRRHSNLPRGPMTRLVRGLGAWAVEGARLSVAPDMQPRRGRRSGPWPGRALRRCLQPAIRDGLLNHLAAERHALGVAVTASLSPPPSRDGEQHGPCSITLTCRDVV
jgi:hypothetical protein